MVRKGARTGASSASAASRSAAPGAFTSFAAATAAALDAAAAPAAPPSDWDASALALLRAASKKDPTTRARALADLAAALDAVPSPPPPAVGGPLLTAWGARFPALAADPSPSVRAAALQVCGRAVTAFGRSSQPILRQVLPPWAGALGDPAAPVAAAAAAALDAAFPTAALRAKLASACGPAIGAYCVAEVDGARASADPAALARAVAAARWVVVASGALDHVATFLDGGALRRAAAGVPVAKKGAPPVCAPREACAFAAAAVVPLLVVGSERATAVARIAEAALRAGEPAAWDLLLALLDAGHCAAFGDWVAVRAAVRAALAARVVVPAALAALLALFSLLPPAAESRVTAEAILDQLRAEIAPAAPAAPAAAAPSAEPAGSALQTHGLRSLFVASALPAYLECVAYAASTGAQRWGDGDLSRRMARDHVEPALVRFLTGALFPPSARRATAGRRPEVGRGGSNGGSGDDPAALFANALTAVTPQADGGGVWERILPHVLPLRGASARELAARLAAVAGHLPAGGQAAIVARVVRDVLRCAEGGETLDEGDLALLVALSEYSAPPAGEEGKVAALALRVGSLWTELAGSALSWVDGPVPVLEMVCGAAALDDASRLRLVAALIAAHKVRGKYVQGDALDAVAVGCSRRLGDADVKFLLAAVAADGVGGARLSPPTFATVVTAVRASLNGGGIVRDAGALCAAVLGGRTPGADVALDELAASAVAAGQSDGVFEYCARVDAVHRDDLLAVVLAAVRRRLSTAAAGGASDAEALGRAWVRAVGAVSRDDAAVSRAAHARAAAVAGDDAAVFRVSIVVAASPRNVLPPGDPHAFVVEYERALSLGDSVLGTGAQRALRGLLACDSAPGIAGAVAKRLLDGSCAADRQEPLLGLLHAAVACDTSPDGWPTTARVAASMAPLPLAPPPLVTRIVAVCSAASRRRGLAAFQTLLDAALVAVRRGAGDGSAGDGLALLGAALAPIEGDGDKEPLADWLAALLTTALRAVRRGLETSGHGPSDRAVVGPGALLAARALSCGYGLGEDERRFWSLVSLDVLREAQLLDVAALGADAVRDVASTALLAAAMVSSLPPADSSGGGDGATADELVRHGASAGVKFLRRVLDDPGRAPSSGLLQLMVAATSRGLLLRSGQALPVEPPAVYELIPLLGHESAPVREAVFGVVSTIACDDLPRYLDVALSGEGCSDEEAEGRAMRELVPEAVRNALRWPAEADGEAASHAELGFFMSWLLFLQLVKGVDARSEQKQEDRSFRRVSLSFLRADSDLFGTFFSRCVGVVVDGNAAERAAAAGASSSILEDLNVWLRRNAGEPTCLNGQVGRCAGAAFAHALQLLPAVSRQHVADHVDHGLALQIEEFVRRRISPLLISEEIRKVREWGASAGAAAPAGGDSEGELTTRGSVAGREVWAAYRLSDVTLEIALRLPEAFPLQVVEVDDADGNTRIGKGLWRKTLLQMNTLLRAKDGSLAEAVGLWRRSLDLRLGGLEDCPVCYSVLHLSNSSLPSVRCGTCSALYHGACLYKWFTKSSTRSCPMCRSSF